VIATMPITTRPTMFALPVIGWKEHVRLPKLGLGPIVAKIDTGARSAALHADEIELRDERVRFVILDEGRKHTYFAPLIGKKRIKSSNGHSETRAVIETTVEIGAQQFVAEITLTDRTDMDVPMLLGRAAIKGRFMVDAGKTFRLKPRKAKHT
jgi:hypothetical protein